MKTALAIIIDLPQDVQRQPGLYIYNGVNQLVGLHLSTRLLRIVGHPKQLWGVVVR